METPPPKPRTLPRWLTWSTADPRTDNLFILLMLAFVAPGAINYLITLVAGEASLPYFTHPFLYAASSLPTLLRWFAEACMYLIWGPGNLVLIIFGAALLLRRCPPGLGLLIFTAFELTHQIGAAVIEIRRPVFPLFGVVGKSLDVVGFATHAAFPLYLFYTAIMEARRTQATPIIPLAARLTRMVLWIAALIHLAPAVSSVHFLIQWLRKYSLAQTPEVIIHPALYLAAAITIAICAARLMRHGRLVPRMLLIAFTADAGRWLLPLALWGVLIAIQPTAFMQMPPAERLTRLSTQAANSLVTLPVLIVLLWYWWPRLAQREIPLTPTDPQCARCGYSLRGNLSGRCPECGEPVVGSSTSQSRDHP